MISIYLYPNSSRNRTGVRNPYMGQLRAALSRHFKIVNAGRPSNRGIFDILQYTRDIDMVFLNWIEDLPGKHMGFLQTLFFLGMIRTFKIRKIKITWILHNKKSHYKEHPFLKKILFNQLLKQSDLIITHAKEGLELIPGTTRSAYFPHPVRPITSPAITDEIPVYDMIIWGSISPYKGIDSFLEYMRDHDALDRYRILIAGKITTTELQKKFKELRSLSSKLIVRDEFIPEPELMELINRSRLVVITYQSETVLSSGVLMDSFSQLIPIIGPSTGAFRDLAELGLIDTFNDFPELLQKIEIQLASETDHKSRIMKMKIFMEEHSWDHFSEQIKHLIKGISVS